MSIFPVRSQVRSGDEPRTFAQDDLPSAGSGFWQSWLRPDVIERLMIFADFILITTMGLSSAIGYHLAMSPSIGKVDTYAAASLLIAANFMLLVSVQHGYELRNITNPFGQVRITVATWTAVFGALLAIAFAMKVSDEFSRGATILFYLSGMVVLSAWKITVSLWTSRALRTGAFSNSRVVVIAEQGLVASSAQIVELRQRGYRLMRMLEIPEKDLASPLLMSSIGYHFNELIGYAKENQIEHVFLLLNWGRQHAIDSILDALKILPIPVHLIPDTNVARFLRYPLVRSSGTWAAELRRAPMSWKERALKRCVDLIGATVALLILAPIMLVTALLIKCTSRGPVFFRQTRNGFNDREFRILKFRTMTVAEDGPTIVQATKNDPRVTRIGRQLRKTSIDELPQLFNVLRGNMSLVGPRPHAAAHNSQYQQLIGNYAFRHHVKPGITGWAQVNGYRGETRALALMEKRVEYDLWYINNWSLWLDVSILMRTAVVAITARSAY